MLKRDGRKNYPWIMAAGIVLLVICACIALGIGQYHVPLQDVISILLGQGSDLANAEKVILNLRLPRILFSMLAGAGLAASGAAFQSLFANPLATPDTLGTASGASFGAALGILLGINSAGIEMLAMLAGIGAIALVFLVSRSRNNNRSMIMVVLAGLVISSLFNAMVSFVKYIGDPNDVLPSITFWLMGSFSGITVRSLRLLSPVLAAGTILLFLMRNRLNTLSLPEEEAQSLGINLPLTRGLVILASASVTAGIVAGCGLIGWVGLLIPHMCRMLFGNNNARIIPGSILFGALFMLITDTVARTLTAAEIPVSILTSLIGAPLFIFLLKKTGGIAS
ncbi:MAG: iron ABC transporter permease [Lactimicrobium sp.]|jgi:iron complex transport system permease protein|uniref:FecCD family ABC transporter permease n=1 Tax=Lactimicrobium sp. TaxID=2563780 RepID=UPI002F355EE4